MAKKKSKLSTMITNWKLEKEYKMKYFKSLSIDELDMVTESVEKYMSIYGINGYMVNFLNILDEIKVEKNDLLI